jgi:hypothetical protein
MDYRHISVLLSKQKSDEKRKVDVRLHRRVKEIYGLERTWAGECIQGSRGDWPNTRKRLEFRKLGTLPHLHQEQTAKGLCFAPRPVYFMQH